MLGDENTNLDFSLRDNLTIECYLSGKNTIKCKHKTVCRCINVYSIYHVLQTGTNLLLNSNINICSEQHKIRRKVHSFSWIISKLKDTFMRSLRSQKLMWNIHFVYQSWDNVPCLQLYGSAAVWSVTGGRHGNSADCLSQQAVYRKQELYLNIVDLHQCHGINVISVLVIYRVYSSCRFIMKIQSTWNSKVSALGNTPHIFYIPLISSGGEKLNIREYNICILSWLTG